GARPSGARPGPAGPRPIGSTGRRVRTRVVRTDRGALDRRGRPAAARTGGHRRSLTGGRNCADAPRRLPPAHSPARPRRSWRIGQRDILLASPGVHSRPGRTFWAAVHGPRNTYGAPTMGR